MLSFGGFGAFSGYPFKGFIGVIQGSGFRVVLFKGVYRGFTGFRV